MLTVCSSCFFDLILVFLTRNFLWLNRASLKRSCVSCFCAYQEIPFAETLLLLSKTKKQILGLKTSSVYVSNLQIIIKAKKKKKRKLWKVLKVPTKFNYFFCDWVFGI